jgi:tetratricopeptide (TPR) repeat protein
MLEPTRNSALEASSNSPLGAIGSVLAIALLVGVAYSNSLHGPLIYDDHLSISENPSIRTLFPLSKSLSPPIYTPVAGRPIVNLSLALNYAVSGDGVWSYHLFNIASHILCALAIYGVVRQTLGGATLAPRFGNSRNSLALTASLLWAVHPLNTETVNYITQRTESMMALCYLLTLYCAIRSFESPQRRLWSVLAVAICGAGMACKESMVTAPILVAIYDWAFSDAKIRQTFRRRWKLYGALASTWLVLVGLNWSGPRADSVGFGIGVSPLDYGLNQYGAIAHYLRLSIWPHPLCIDYGIPRNIAIGEAVAPGLLVLSLLAATLVLFRRHRTVAFLGVWVFVILAPTSTLIPISTEAAAERRMYLPLVALCVSAVLGGRLALQRFSNRPARMRVGIAILAIAVLTAGTWRRNGDYRSAISIWRSAVAANPNNPRALTNLGTAIRVEGNLPEAAHLFRTALEIDEKFGPAHYNLGDVLLETGMIGDAIRHFQEAIHAEPRDVQARIALGELLEDRGRSGEAFEHYRAAAAVRPRSVPILNKLGVAFAQVGDFEIAENQFRAAAELDPRSVAAQVNLGNALFYQGKHLDAVRHYERALAIDPDHATAHRQIARALLSVRRIPLSIKHLREAVRIRPQRAEPIVDLARILATHPAGEIRRAEEAIELAKRAATITKRQDPRVLDVLAAAYASKKQFEQALTTAHLALSVCGPGDDGLANEIQARMVLYGQSEPYIDREAYGDGPQDSGMSVREE